MRTGRGRIQSLCMACQNGDLDVIKNAIADGTDLNRLYKMNQSDVGSLLLYIASENGHLEIVEVLIASGGLVNQGHK